jgi:hypothetical protein
MTSGLAVSGTPAAPATGDWGLEPPRYPPADRWRLLALVLVPALCVSAVVAVLLGSWWLGLALFLLWLAKCFVDAAVKDPVQLPRSGARPLPPEQGARLRNLSAGLADELGVAAPQLYLIDSPGWNSFVRTGGKGGVLAVTRGLLEGATRTELEAVVAHGLKRIHGPSFAYTNLAARWSDLGAGLAPRVDAASDVAAVSLTRYPPALANVLSKCDGRVERYAPLWFVADAPSHQPVRDRVAVVADL